VHRTNATVENTVSSSPIRVRSGRNAFRDESGQVELKRSPVMRPMASPFGIYRPSVPWSPDTFPYLDFSRAMKPRIRHKSVMVPWNIAICNAHCAKYLDIYNRLCQGSNLEFDRHNRYIIEHGPIRIKFVSNDNQIFHARFDPSPISLSTLLFRVYPFRVYNSIKRMQFVSRNRLTLPFAAVC
jgi:hypothetical protein